MENNPLNFWQELKRRRVVRIIPVYAASAFVVLELVDIIAEPFGLPDWTLQFLVLLLVIGLIISVILSWVYDITPKGLKRTKPVDEEIELHPETASQATRWKVATFVSLGIIICLIILNIVTGSRVRSGFASDLEKTIAVLPFQNLSHDTAQSYFCEGIREEILFHLQKIEAFSVRSRTSADQYRHTDMSVTMIGNELNAKFLVEGSIGFEADQLKIWVQLIDAKKDKHIWAGDYIKEMSNVFSLQSEIAQTIASELQVVLSPGEIKEIDNTPTDNLEAYQAYLRGRYYANQPHFTLHYWMMALENFQEAVEIDKEFALAYAELARAHGRLRYLRQDLSEWRLEEADRAAENAMLFGANDPRVHLALGYYYLYAYRDEEQALKHLEIAEKGMPNNSEILVEKAVILLPQGRWEETIQLLEKASKLSPREANILAHLTFCLWCTRNNERGIEVAEQAIALAPDSNWPYIYKAYIIWSKTRPNQETRDIITHIDPEHEWFPYSWYWQEAGEGNLDAALELMSDTTEIWGVHHKMWTVPRSMMRAFIHDFRGENELAHEEYQDAVDVLQKKIVEVPIDPRYHSALGIAYAALGEKEKAIEQGMKATALLPVDEDAVYGLTYIYDLAIIYIKLGEYDLALDQVEFLFQVPSWFSPGWVDLDFRFTPIRSHSRYQRLLAAFETE